jgi:hypothetical protein
MLNMRYVFQRIIVENMYCVLQRTIVSTTVNFDSYENSLIFIEKSLFLLIFFSPHNTLDFDLTTRLLRDLTKFDYANVRKAPHNRY